MKVEETIAKIIAACPCISRDQILRRLEKEKERTGGFISDDVLLDMIGAEFGCRISRSEAKSSPLLFRDLVPGLSDITVTGRVVAVFNPRTFDRKRKGKVADLLIADKSGVLRTVLWNDKTSLAESGDTIVDHVMKFSHAYTREDSGGRVEVHLGERGEIEIDPKDIAQQTYPNIREFLTRIGDLNQGRMNKRVHVEGLVTRTSPVSTFDRKKGGQGKVMRIILEDYTDQIQVAIWNERVDEMEHILTVGNKAQFVNAKIKKALQGGIEIHVDHATYIRSTEHAQQLLSIIDLKDGMFHADVAGEISTEPAFKEVTTTKGENVELAIFELKDKTGNIWVSAWRRHALKARLFRLGDEITIRNAYVKKGFGDRLEISTRQDTSIVRASHDRLGVEST